MSSIRVFLIAIFIGFIVANTVDASWGRSITIQGREYRVATYDDLRKMGMELPDVRFFENSAQNYINAINLYVEVPEELQDQYDHVSSHGWDPECKGLEQWLQNNQDALKEIFAAVEKPYFVFPVLSNNERISTFDISLPHLSFMRNLTRMLDIRAKLALSKGQFSIAVESWRCILLMSEHLGQDRILISGLIGSACRGIAIGGIRKTVLRQNLNPAQLEELLKLIEPFYKTPPNPYIALKTDKTLALQMVNDISFKIGKISHVPRIVVQTHIRDSWSEWEEALRQPFHEFIKRYNNKQETDSLIPEMSFLGLIQSLIPSYYRIRVMYADRELRMNSLALTIGLEMYRKKHNQYPEAITDLERILEPIPLDPFTGEYLIYVKTEDGYIFYSLGENLIDDKGNPGESRYDQDIVFTSEPRTLKPYTPVPSDTTNTPYGPGPYGPGLSTE